MFLLRCVILVSLLLSTSCATHQRPAEKHVEEIPEGYVTESVAIMLMGKSFFVGCMTALHAHGFKAVAQECQKLSRDHAQEIKDIVNQKQIP